MIINVKLKQLTDKMLWEEAVHTCKCVRNSMLATNSQKSLFEMFYGEKPNIIGSFSEFRCITYVTKRGNIKVWMK